MRDEGKQEKDEQPTSQKQSNVKESAVSLETKWGTPIKETQNPKGLVPQHRTQLYQRGTGAESLEPKRQNQNGSTIANVQIDDAGVRKSKRHSSTIQMTRRPTSYGETDSACDGRRGRREQNRTQNRTRRGAHRTSAVSDRRKELGDTNNVPDGGHIGPQQSPTAERN